MPAAAAGVKARMPRSVAAALCELTDPTHIVNPKGHHKKTIEQALMKSTPTKRRTLHHVISDKTGQPVFDRARGPLSGQSM